VNLDQPHDIHRPLEPHATVKLTKPQLEIALWHFQVIDGSCSNVAPINSQASDLKALFEEALVGMP
jgi:hypothetical protein